MYTDVLQCGPLSMAVLARSESLVRSRLRSPAVFNEKNAAGQNPLHLCADWVQGAQILVNFGFPCDQLDFSHLLPIDYAISIGGDARAAKVLLNAGSPLKCCYGIHGWFTTLDSALHSATRPEQELLSQWPPSPNISCLVDNLKCRRERLAQIAEAHLPRTVLNEIQILGTAIDGGRVHATWEALEKAGVKTSSILRTHEIPVYHQVRSRSFAMYLYNMGFEKLDDYDQYGRTPLAGLACLHESDNDLDILSDRLDLAQWYLVQGMDPLHPCRDHDISTWHIAAFYGILEIHCSNLQKLQDLGARFAESVYNSQWLDPVIMEILFSKTFEIPSRALHPMILLLAQEAAPECQDSCCCGCSRHGCTPTTKFLVALAGLERRTFQDYKSVILYETLALWYDWCHVLAAKGIPMSTVRGEVQRFVAFQKLGLTHTCCEIGSSYSDNAFSIMRMPIEDANEIREEEGELLNRLENMLQQPESDWWGSPSELDILLDVNDDGKPPTIRWANLWLAQRSYGLDEEACEKLRLAAGLSKKVFWESAWRFWGYWPRGLCGEVQWHLEVFPATRSIAFMFH